MDGIVMLASASNNANNNVVNNANSNASTVDDNNDSMVQGNDDPWTIGRYVAWVLSSIIILFVMMLTSLSAYSNRLETVRVSREQAQSAASDYMNDHGIMSMRDDPCTSTKCDDYIYAFNDDNGDTTTHTVVIVDNDSVAHRGVLVTVDGKVSMQGLTD